MAQYLTYTHSRLAGISRLLPAADHQGPKNAHAHRQGRRGQKPHRSCHALAMLDSKREASGLLHEHADEQAVQKLKRAQQRKIQSERTPNQRKNKSTLNVKLRLEATFFLYGQEKSS